MQCPLQRDVSGWIAKDVQMYRAVLVSCHSTRDASRATARLIQIADLAYTVHAIKLKDIRPVVLDEGSPAFEFDHCAQGGLRGRLDRVVSSSLATEEYALQWARHDLGRWETWESVSVLVTDAKSLAKSREPRVAVAVAELKQDFPLSILECVGCTPHQEMKRRCLRIANWKESIPDAIRDRKSTSREERERAFIHLEANAKKLCDKGSIQHGTVKLDMAEQLLSFAHCECV
eukprot:6323381-Amphidinium_carterae.1